MNQKDMKVLMEGWGDYIDESSSNKAAKVFYETSERNESNKREKLNEFFHLLFYLVF